MEELLLDRKEPITIENLAREIQGTKILGIIQEIGMIPSMIQIREVFQKGTMIEMTIEIIILHILTINHKDSNNYLSPQENNHFFASNAE